MNFMRLITFSACFTVFNGVCADGLDTEFSRAQLKQQEKQNALAQSIADEKKYANLRLEKAIEKGKELRKQLSGEAITDVNIKLAYFNWPRFTGEKSVTDYELSYTSPSLNNTKAILDFMASMTSDGFFVKRTEVLNIERSDDSRNTMMQIRFYKM